MRHSVQAARLLPLDAGSQLVRRIHGGKRMEVSVVCPQVHVQDLTVLRCDSRQLPDPVRRQIGDGRRPTPFGNTADPQFVGSHTVLCTR